MNLKLVFLNGSFCSLEFMPYYKAAYTHWKSLWSQTFKEVDGSNELYSDNFTRQDEILAVFDGSKCIALVCNRFINPQLISHQDDSYFATWPKEELSKIQADGLRVVVGNQITIEPDYRKLPDGTHMKDLLMWFYYRRQWENVDLTFAAVREDKNLDKLFQKFGAEIIKPHDIQHHIPTALMVIWSHKIQLHHPELPMDEMERIYGEKLDDIQYTKPVGKILRPKFGTKHPTRLTKKAA